MTSPRWLLAGALVALHSPLLAQSAAGAGPAAIPGAPDAAPNEQHADPAQAEPHSAEGSQAARDESWTRDGEASDSEEPSVSDGARGPAPTGPGLSPARQAAAGAPPELLAPTGDAAPSLGTHQRHFGVQIGLRTSFIQSSGFDPFAEKDALAELSAALGGVWLASERLSLAAFAGFETGGKEASARGEKTELDVKRLLLFPELRWHLWPTFYVYAKPTVGATRVRAALIESGEDGSMVAKNWGLSLDASGGGAFELLGNASGARTGVRAWLLAEGGYGTSSKFQLKMKPEGDSLPARAEPVDLGALRLSGPFFRLMLALTY